jgi:hypothetical protein
VIRRLERALVDRPFINRIYSRAAPPISTFEDSNQIYSLIIREKYLVNDKFKLVVFQSETTSCPFYENEFLKDSGRKRSQTFQQSIKEIIPAAELQTLDNYLARNKASGELMVSNLGFNYVLVKDNDLPPDRLDFWAKFYDKYPNSPGVIYFSNVGFNENHDQAFVYVGRTCDGLCGSGEYVLLSKADGTWKIVGEQGLWVS